MSASFAEHDVNFLPDSWTHRPYRTTKIRIQPMSNHGTHPSDAVIHPPRRIINLTMSTLVRIVQHLGLQPHKLTALMNVLLRILLCCFCHPQKATCRNGRANGGGRGDTGDMDDMIASSGASREGAWIRAPLQTHQCQQPWVGVGEAGNM